MRRLKLSAAVLTPLLLLDACASQPMSPTVGVMPAAGKPFDVFQTDQVVCKDFATQQVQGGAQQANNRQVGTALVGTAVGTAPVANAQESMQQRYDLAYAQCMYARGNQVPGYLPPGAPPPPPAYAPRYYPPPPPGY